MIVAILLADHAKLGLVSRYAQNRHQPLYIAPDGALIVRSNQGMDRTVFARHIIQATERCPGNPLRRNPTANALRRRRLHTFCSTFLAPAMLLFPESRYRISAELPCRSLVPQDEQSSAATALSHVVAYR